MHRNYNTYIGKIDNRENGLVHVQVYTLHYYVSIFVSFEFFLLPLKSNTFFIVCSGIALQHITKERVREMLMSATPLYVCKYFSVVGDGARKSCAKTKIKTNEKRLIGRRSVSKHSAVLYSAECYLCKSVYFR